MLIRRFCQIFLNSNKCGRLLNFSPKPFLFTVNKALPSIRSTASVTSPPVVDCDNVSGTSETLRRPYFLQYLLNNSDMYCVVNTDNINLEERSNFDSLELIKDIINNPELTEVPKEVEDCLVKEISDYGLEEIYKFIILTSNHSFKNISYELYKHLNDELLRRKFSFEDILKIFFVFDERYSRFRSLKCSFIQKNLSKLCHKIQQLNPQQAVQVMFHMRRIDPAIVKKFKFGVQQYFAEKIPQLNFDELGIIASGFIKGNISVSHNELPVVIINKATEEIENIHDIPFGQLCKLFASSLRMSHRDAVLNFQEKVIPHVPRLSMNSIVGLAESGSRIHAMNSVLWETLASTFKESINNTTLGHIQRMVGAATACNIKDEELFNLVIKIFEAEDNIIENSKYLISVLFNFALHKLYPDELLSLIFSSELNCGKMRFTQQAQYFFIYCCVELEKPTFKFDSLDFRTRKKMFTVHNVFMETDTRQLIPSKITRRMHNNNRDVLSILGNLHGQDSVYLTRCLPHFGRGIVMRFDKTFKAWSIPDEFKQLERYYAKKAFKDDLFWIFIKIEHPGKFLPYSETPSLLIQTEIRQLEALGYKYVLIQEEEWKKHCLDRTESDFLMYKITKNLKEVMGQKLG